jgi:HlyD family secretion protein
VRLQLDAFNYNQWGMAEATVSEIGRDVSTVDGQAAFRVVCTLHDRELRLKNGYVGTLRKGMTLTAHFTLTRRTLFQLLHDKVDDWFNPSYN